MNERIWHIVLCLVIGYVFGNFMTAEVVTRRLTGKPCSELGTTGNPGMANVMANLGFKPGILTLAGDLAKTFVSAMICRLLFYDTLGQICVLYAGLGCVLGHDFPVWMKGKGGKGVAVTCLSLGLFSFPWGLLANIAGMLTVFATKYLCIGAVVIPGFFIIPAFAVFGTECGVLSVILTVLMLIRHFSRIRLIPSGRCEKTDVPGAIRKALQKLKRT